MSSLLRKIAKGKFNPALATAGGKRIKPKWVANYRMTRPESKYQPHNGFNVVYSTTTNGHIVREFVK